jgi:hypothetical protein
MVTPASIDPMLASLTRSHAFLDKIEIWESSCTHLVEAWPFSPRPVAALTMNSADATQGTVPRCQLKVGIAISIEFNDTEARCRGDSFVAADTHALAPLRVRTTHPYRSRLPWSTSYMWNPVRHPIVPSMNAGIAYRIGKQLRIRAREGAAIASRIFSWSCAYHYHCMRTVDVGLYTSILVQRLAIVLPNGMHCRPMLLPSPTVDYLILRSFDGNSREK